VGNTLAYWHECWTSLCKELVSYWQPARTAVQSGVTVMSNSCFLQHNNQETCRKNNAQRAMRNNSSMFMSRKLWGVKFRVFSDVAPCSHVEVDRRFRGASCLQHSSDNVRQYASLKLRFTSTWLHGATSQKTLNFILAAVRTWNLTLRLVVVCGRWRSKFRNYFDTSARLIQRSLPIIVLWWIPDRIIVRPG
jgi:hypothetical protein